MVKKYFLILLVTSSFIALFAAIQYSHFFFGKSPEHIIERNIHREIKKMDKTLERLKNLLEAGESIEQLSDKRQVFIFENNRITFWSTVDYEITSEDIVESNGRVFVVNNKFGLFLALKDTFEAKVVVVTTPFYRKYRIENKYIHDAYNKSLLSNFQVVFSEDEGVDIHHGERFLLKLNLPQNQKESKALWVYIYLAASLIFIIFWNTFYAQQSLNFWLFAINLFVFRAVGLLLSADFSIPILYDSKYFASSFINPSLGELILNCITFISLFVSSAKFLKKLNAKWVKLPLAFCILVYVTAVILNDSSVQITPFNIIMFDFNVMVLCLMLVVLNVFFLTFLLNFYQSKFHTDVKFIVGSLVVPLTVYFIFNHLVTALVITLFYAILSLVLSSDFKVKIHYYLIISLFVISGVVSLVQYRKDISFYESKRELSATQILQKNDEYFEYLVNEISQKISKDKIIITGLTSPFVNYNSLINNKIQKIYFKDFYKNYALVPHIVSIESILRDDDTLVIDSVKYFVKKTPYEDLYLLPEKEFNAYKTYAKLICFDDDVVVKNIFIIFKEKDLSGGGLRPKLLLSKDFEKENINSTSFCIIKNGIIKQSEGDFDYYAMLKNKVFLNDSSFYYDGYRHTLASDGNMLAIVSSRHDFMRMLGKTFSLYTVLYAVVFIFILIYARYSYSHSVSLLERVQLVIAFMIFLTVLVLTLLSSNSTKNSFKTESENRYLDIAKRVTKSLESLALTDYSQLQENLIQFSKNYDADIHFYDTEGKLVISTLPEIFDYKLLSDRLDFEMLNIESPVVRDEKIGDFNYHSVYYPFKLENNLLGIVNVPFYTSWDRSASIIDNLIYNILFLSLFGLFLLMFVADKLTSNALKPILLISQKFSKLSLENNEKLDVYTHDEIGKLVSSYNKMVDKLQISREELKKKEKESAWKEMAQQVAHEIKNPLTPMKLSLQFLEHTSKSSEVDKKRLQQTINSLLHQIESLNKIVESFSSFAKMPDYELEKTEILAIVKSVVNTYNSTVKINISSDEELYYAKVDVKSFSGIINNLLLNAIQSVKNREPLIEINLSSRRKNLLMSIKDNGEGIPQEIQDKVFVPNFTTKFAGSGIGLALAKKGIEAFGGQIYFETVLGSGTTFYIELPLAV